MKLFSVIEFAFYRAIGSVKCQKCKKKIGLFDKWEIFKYYPEHPGIFMHSGCVPKIKGVKKK